MITKETATTLATQYLQSLRLNEEVKIMEELTKEEDFGWMFFYQSKVYVETGDESSLLGGNAPLIVDKHSGAVVVTGTRLDEEDYIILYKKYKGSIEAFHKACREYIPK